MTPLTGISSMATRGVLAELARLYAEATRQRVDVIAIGGVDATRRVQEGDAFDFVVLARDVIDRLASQDRVDRTTITDIVRSDIAVAVAKGAPKPDIGSESALREAVLRARRVGYSSGPSGDYVRELLARWRLADVLASRLVRTAPGVPVGSLIANGDVELGFQQLSELMHVPGVDVVGLLPAAIRRTTVFTAAVCEASTQPEATRALLAYLASDAAEAAKRRHGMDPAIGSDTTSDGTGV
ncbi:MAG TPA: substrate-binding domain-containing protein [Casimicrobiaceae bacterium]|nr:substrate-binding domain-containing protein [Casimicrobiaceae bacterium]